MDRAVRRAGLGLSMGALCAVLRATETFQRVKLTFLQLEKCGFKFD